MVLCLIRRLHYVRWVEHKNFNFCSCFRCFDVEETALLWRSIITVPVPAKLLANCRQFPEIYKVYIFKVTLILKQYRNESIYKKRNARLKRLTKVKLNSYIGAYSNFAISLKLVCSVGWHNLQKLQNLISMCDNYCWSNLF